MNILFIIPNFKIKGSHIPMARIASQLSTQEGVKVYVYNIHPEQDPPHDYSLKTKLAPGVKIINNLPERLLAKSGLFPLAGRIIKRFKHQFNEKQLKYIIKKYKIDIINSHAFLADFFVYNHRVALKDVVKVSTWHGCYESTYNDYQGEEQETFKRNIINTCNNGFNAIVYVSDKQKKYIHDVFRLKVPNFEKIYYGIGTNLHLPEAKPELFQQLSQQVDAYEIVYGMISANSPAKGWEELIVSFTQLKRETETKIALVLIGGQELFDDFKARYPSEDIFYVDKVDNPLLYMQLFTIGVLPSYYPAENLPNVIIEYLLSGLPVISTAWAEIPQMIQHKGGVAGEIIPLVEGKPAIEDLKKAMRKYIDSPSKVRTEGNLAKDIVKEKFCIKEISSAYMQLFKELLNRN